MVKLVVRTLLVALTLWAFLPAAVCQATCADFQMKRAEMPCHAASGEDQHVDDCPKCTDRAALFSQSGPDLATGVALVVAPPQPAFTDLRSPYAAHLSRAPPGLNSPYQRSNRPLLN